jgi:polyisoprenoid-binding protein YceI
MIRRSWLAAFALLAAVQVAKAADWKADTATSRLDFAATFEKTAAPGTFKDFDTRMHFDASAPAEGRLDVSITVKSADMNSNDINKAIGGPEWFDFARFPQAVFHATELRRTGGDRFLARGTLNLKGVQQTIDVPFTWVESGNTAQMEGEFTVQRSAFGIGTGEWVATNVIGADVKVKFNLRMRKVG